MTTTLWTQVQARFFTRRTDDGWIADVWQTRRAGRWRASVTDADENTTRYVATFSTDKVAKSTIWKFLQEQRARAHNVVEVTL